MVELKSKYVDFGTMSFAHFSKSELGTVAKFCLTCVPNSRDEVSIILESACHNAGSSCQITTTDLLVKIDELTWQQTHILEAKITKAAKL
jgi:hypothetical protein